MFYIIRNWFYLMSIISSVLFFGYVGVALYTPFGKRFMDKHNTIAFLINVFFGLFWVISVGGAIELTLSECYYV